MKMAEQTSVVMDSPQKYQQNSSSGGGFYESTAEAQCDLAQIKNWFKVVDLLVSELIPVVRGPEERMRAPAIGIGSWEERIRSFSKLKKGWDGSDCEPPNVCAIENAMVVLNKLWALGVLQYRINPSPDEGILLEAESGPTKIVFELFNTGEIGIVKKSGTNKELLEISRDQIESTLDRLVHA